MPEVGPLPEQPSTDLVRTSPSQGDVMMPLNPDQLVESFQAYQQLRGRLLTDSDYQSAGRGQSFVKKSGWRKIATAFGLNLEIVRSVVERADDGSAARAEVWCRAIAPNGRFADGDGYCDVAEDRFSGSRGNKSKLENDLRATATTRASNRAISNLVGMGEVSAEEVGRNEPELPPHGAEAGQENIAAMGGALAWLSTLLASDLDSPIEAPQVLDALTQAYGYVPGPSVGGIILLAKTIKASITIE